MNFFFLHKNLSFLETKEITDNLQFTLHTAGQRSRYVTQMVSGKWRSDAQLGDTINNSQSIDLAILSGNSFFARRGKKDFK